MTTITGVASARYLKNGDAGATATAAEEAPRLMRFTQPSHDLTTRRHLRFSFVVAFYLAIYRGSCITRAGAGGRAPRQVAWDTGWLRITNNAKGNKKKKTRERKTRDAVKSASSGAIRGSRSRLVISLSRHRAAFAFRLLFTEYLVFVRDPRPIRQYTIGALFLFQYKKYLHLFFSF